MGVCAAVAAAAAAAATATGRAGFLFLFLFVFSFLICWIRHIDEAVVLKAAEARLRRWRSRNLSVNGPFGPSSLSYRTPSLPCTRSQASREPAAAASPSREEAAFTALGVGVRDGSEERSRSQASRPGVGGQRRRLGEGETAAAGGGAGGGDAGETHCPEPD